MYAKWHIDLPTCNRLQLEEMGIRDIYLSGICTFQQHQDYFSARRLGINSGRIFTGIMLR
jgi:copper oxidase (laccase) domain-containing protein